MKKNAFLKVLAMLCLIFTMTNCDLNHEKEISNENFENQLNSSKSNKLISTKLIDPIPTGIEQDCPDELPDCYNVMGCDASGVDAPASVVYLGSTVSIPNNYTPCEECMCVITGKLDLYQGNTFVLTINEGALNPNFAMPTSWTIPTFLLPAHDYSIKFTIINPDLPPPNSFTNSSGQFSIIPPSPAAPSNLIVHASGTIFNLSWTDNSDSETHFELEESIGDQNNFVRIDGGQIGANRTGYMRVRRNPYVKHYYRLRACDDYSCSGNSNVASNKVLGKPIKLPF